VGFELTNGSLLIPLPYSQYGAPGTAAAVALIAAVRAAPGAPASKPLGRLLFRPLQVAVVLAHAAHSVTLD